MELARKVSGNEASNDQVNLQSHGAPARTHTINRLPKLVGDSDVIRKIKHTIDRIALTDMTVLLTGESGTGKEEIARLIHLLSKRASTLFSAINCAAFPSELVESELFGHERGAFTGACVRRIGRLEAADGSTLLLDEIGEMPLPLQAKLLRFLQEREIQRLGSNHTIRLNVRIIAATNRILPEEIKSGRFRSDLFYRLGMCQLVVPPLRERREDIRPLVAHFAAALAGGQTAPLFTDDALRVLEQHDWLGNVRELANAVEFAISMCSGGIVSVDDLPESVRDGDPTGEGKCGTGNAPDSQNTLLRIPPLARGKEWRSGISRNKSERLAIARQVIEECGGNKTRAAKEIGISRQRLHRVLKEGEE